MAGIYIGKPYTNRKGAVRVQVTMDVADMDALAAGDKAATAAWKKGLAEHARTASGPVKVKQVG